MMCAGNVFECRSVLPSETSSTPAYRWFHVVLVDPLVVENAVAGAVRVAPYRLYVRYG